MTISRPFLTTQDSVAVGPWVDDDGDLIGENARFGVFSPLVLRTSVQIDMQALANEVFPASPDETDKLVVTVVVRSDKTKIQVPCFNEKVCAVVPIEIRVDGGLLGGTITVVTSVVVERNASGAISPSPKESGLVVFRSETSILLEGVGPQMPSVQIDFAEAGLRKRAMWTVDYTESVQLCADDFHEPFVEHVRLFINSGSDALTKLLTEPTTSALLISAMARDIAGAVLDMASSAEFEQSHDYSFGSLGHQIKVVLSRAKLSGPSEYSLLDASERGAILQDLAYG
jgi:hypothetical protein